MCARAQSCPTVTPWTGAHQAPLSMRFPGQEYWSGLPFPPPGDLPDPGIELTTSASPALAGGFFTTAPPGRLPGPPGRLSNNFWRMRVTPVLLPTFLYSQPSLPLGGSLLGLFKTCPPLLACLVFYYFILRPRSVWAETREALNKYFVECMNEWKDHERTFIGY